MLLIDQASEQTIGWVRTGGNILIFQWKISRYHDQCERTQCHIWVMTPYLDTAQQDKQL